MRFTILSIATVTGALLGTGCVVNDPPPQHAGQQQYGTQQPAGQQTYGAPAQATQTSVPATRGTRYDAQQHNVAVNGVRVTADVLLQFARHGLPLPSGSYWYDRRCGAFGIWGGPTAIFLPAGLNLGGQLAPNASGGATNVAINGRILHPSEVRYLMQLAGRPIQPGRYWLDAMGNVGFEGGPALANLVQLARARGSSGGGGKGYFRRGWGGTVSSDGKCYYVSTKAGSVMGPGC